MQYEFFIKFTDSEYCEAKYILNNIYHSRKRFLANKYNEFDHNMKQIKLCSFDSFPAILSIHNYFNKSGLSRFVLSSDCSIRHSAMLRSCPDSNTSGTRQPLYSAGRV